MQNLPRSQRRMIFVPIVLVTAIASLSAPLDAQRSRRSDRPELENLRFEVRKFESAALGDKEVDYAVFLPKDYDEEENAEKHYPLLIWLHGMREDHQRFMYRGGGAILDRLTGEGAFPEAVVVCPDGGAYSFWTNAVGKEDGRVEDMVVQDLLPHLESSFRLESDRTKRAIGGVSMGGYGALKIGFKNPERFGVVFGHAAAVLPDSLEDLYERFQWISQGGRGLLTSVYGDPVDADRYEQDNLLVLARTLDPKTAETMRIYFDAGDEDRYGFGNTNRLLSEELDRREIVHEWILVEGGGHSWRSGFTQARLPESLAFVAREWARKKALTGLGALLGGKPDAETEGGEKEPESGTGGGDGR